MPYDVNTARVPRASNVPYYTPAQVPAPGTALSKQADGKPIPKLFQPLTIRGVTFPNRVWLSPMDQYSSDNGVPTQWHMAHIGGILTRGPGLAMMECASILPNGRIAPEDAGIWNDEQVAGYKEITSFAHGQNTKIGIQIAHAGRKASTRAAWLQSHDFGVGYLVSEEDGGWPNDLIAPTAEAWSEKLGTPREMTVAEIKENVQAWAAAARRAVEAGFDVIELHGAHGFLLHQFASPTSNKRTDAYGGSWENRVRFNLEVVDAVRAVIPEDMPLFYRVSSTEYLEEVTPNEPQWRLEDTVKFAALLAEHGVDLIDLSSGGNSTKQVVRRGHLYQVPFAEAVKKTHGDKIHVAAVGGITNGVDAQSILADGKADVVFVGRQFQKNSGAAWQFAADLGLELFVSIQHDWATFGRGEAIARRSEQVAL